MKRSKGISQFFQMIDACLKLSWRTSPAYTLIRFAGLMLIPLISVAATYISKYILNLLAGEWTVEAPMRVGVLLLFGIFTAGIFNAGLNKIVEYVQKMHEDKLNAQMTMDIMDSALSVDLASFDDAAYYDKLQMAGGDMYAVSGILWNVLTFFSYGISFMSVFVLICTNNVLFALLMTLAAVPSAVVGTRYTKVLYDFSVERMNQERQKGYYHGLASSREYAQDIRLYRIGDILKQRYERIWRTLFDKERRLVKKRTVWTVICQCLPEVTAFGISVYIVGQILDKSRTIGDYTLYTGLMAQLIASVTVVISSAMQIYDNRLRIANIMGLKDFAPEIKDDGRDALETVTSVEFCHVSFKYPKTEKWVLKDVSFKIEKNEKVAFVGLNGSGKSTLIKLMLRLYEPDEGDILMNGQNIKTYTIESLRSHFSVYFQEMLNYCFSLRDNVTLGDMERQADDTETMRCLKLSCGDDILKKAKNGLDTQVMRILDESGMEMSGGQHQKLALARTFYRRHSVLVLDEPSSSLDPKAEHDIFEVLEKMAKGHMTIFTSHRLLNTYLADRIIVLEAGEIIEEGTQSELLKNNRRFAQLFKYQQEKFQVNTEGKDSDENSSD